MITTNSPELVEMLQELEQWYTGRRAQLQEIVDNPDTDIRVPVTSGQYVVLDKHQAYAFRQGLATALQHMGEFPLKMKPVLADEEE